MDLAKNSWNILSKLAFFALLLLTFAGSALWVLSKALQSPEIVVPQVVGKNYQESERDLAALGLQIRKRTDRFSEEAPNTVLEQSPLAGDTVKAGQTIAVVTARPNADSGETAAQMEKKTVAEDKSSDEADKPSEVDQARKKRRAAAKNDDDDKPDTSNNKKRTGNKKSNSNSNGNGNSNTSGNSNGGNANGNSNASKNGNSNTSKNGASNAARGSNSSNRNADTAPASNRNANNRRPQ